MDFNHAYEAELDSPCLPEQLFSIHKTQLEIAKKCCLYIEKHYPEVWNNFSFSLEHHNFQNFKYRGYVENQINNLNKTLMQEYKIPLDEEEKGFI